MIEMCFTDPETIQQLILEDEELRYLELQEQKVPNWEMCGKTFLNPLYASGKRYKFRLKCGNTRKCDKCRNDMIKKLEKETLKVGVPLYCHLIGDEADVWENWRKWFCRNRSELDKYWKYPLKDGTCMVVSTMQRYRDIPILINPEAHIRQWIKDRGDTAKITQSENAVNCSNPSCKVLLMPRKRVCPECGTEYKPEKEFKEKTIRIPRLTEDEQKFFEEILRELGYRDDEWSGDIETVEWIVTESRKRVAKSK